MTFYLNYGMMPKAFQFAEKHLDKGKILLKLKKYKSALKCFQQYLQHLNHNNGGKKDRADANFHIARTHELLKQYPKAL